MLFERQDDYTALLKRGAYAQGKDILGAIQRLAGHYKSPTFTIDQARIRDHYEGRGEVHTMRRIQRMHPNNAPYILPVSYNWLKLRASTGASVYDNGVTRALVDPKTNEEIDSDDPRSIEFARTLEESRIAVVMPEAERRKVISGNAVVMVRARRSLDEFGELKTRVALDLHWASECFAVPHPSAPHDPLLMVAFGLRISSVEGDTWEVWTRDVENDSVGMPVRFGNWIVNTIHPDGKQSAPVEYLGKRFPGLIFADGIPAGGPWFNPGSDDVALVEHLNALASDRAFLTGSQSHTDLVLRGRSFDGKEIPVGPGRVIQIGPTDDLTTLDYNPKTIEMIEGEREYVRMWAQVSRQSMEAYSPGSQAPASGVARQIANEPQEKMRREKIIEAREFELRMLLPTIAEVHDLYVDGPEFGGMRFSFEPVSSSSYEEPEAKQRRAVDALAANLVTPAAAAVMAELYSSIDDAVRAGLSNEFDAPMLMGDKSDAIETATQERAQTSDVVDEKPEEIATDVPDVKQEATTNAADATTAFNGAQSAALVDILERAASGAIPRESALQALIVCFPVDEAQADKLLGPIGKTFIPPSETPPAPKA